MSLTIDGGGKQRRDNLPLALLVFVEETLETVEDCTSKHKRLSLIHHGHEQNNDSWSAEQWRGEIRGRSQGTGWREEFVISRPTGCASYLGGFDGALTEAK